MKTKFPHFLFAAALSGWAAPARAAVIDLFTGNPQEWTASLLVGNAPVSASLAPLTGSLFQTRTLTMAYGAQQILIRDGALRYETLAVTPAPGPWINDNGYLTVTYSSDRPINLLEGGATAFEIHFQAFKELPPYGFWLRIRSFDGHTSAQAPIPEFGSGASFPARVMIPFTRFDGLDLSAVQEVTLETARMLPGTSFTLTGFSTVPEPSSSVLAAALCASGGALRHRPKRKNA